MGDAFFPGGQQVRPAHQVVHGPDAQLCHDLPQLLRDKQHEIHDVLGLAGKAAPELRILGGDAHGAGVHIAHPHHDAAHGDKRCRGEAEFLRPQHTGDGHIPAAHELAVGFQPNPGAQAVADQGLVGLRKAQLPGKPRIVNGALGGGPGAAVIAGDQDAARPRLGNPRGNGADTGLGYQLDRNSRVPVGVFQVKNQLGQILDGIDVVVGRRGDQGDTGGGAAGLGDPGIDLLAGQMPALSGLGPLGHFDLDLLGAV